MPDVAARLVGQSLRKGYEQAHVGCHTTLSRKIGADRLPLNLLFGPADSSSLQQIAEEPVQGGRNGRRARRHHSHCEGGQR